MTGLTTHTKKFQQVSVDKLDACPVPCSTNTYEPVPHGLFYDMVTNRLMRHGYLNVAEDLRITESGDEFFGIIRLRTQGRENSPWDLSLGLRNTNNKRASAGVFLGTNVWVCDNLCFSAEHTFLRKHHAGTINVLALGIEQVLSHLPEYHEAQRTFVADLQRWVMTPAIRDHMLVNLVRYSAVRANELLPVLHEFIKPSSKNPEAQYDSGWGLFNAVTWVGKNGFERNPETQAARTLKTTQLFQDTLKEESWQQ